MYKIETKYIIYLFFLNQIASLTSLMWMLLGSNAYIDNLQISMDKILPTSRLHRSLVNIHGTMEIQLMLLHITHSKEHGVRIHPWNHYFIKSPFRCNFRLGLSFLYYYVYRTYDRSTFKVVIIVSIMNIFHLKIFV